MYGGGGGGGGRGMTFTQISIQCTLDTPKVDKLEGGGDIALNKSMKPARVLQIFQGAELGHQTF